MANEIKIQNVWCVDLERMHAIATMCNRAVVSMYEPRPLPEARGVLMALKPSTHVLIIHAHVRSFSFRPSEIPARKGYSHAKYNWFSLPI